MIFFWKFNLHHCVIWGNQKLLCPDVIETINSAITMLLYILPGYSLLMCNCLSWQNDKCNSINKAGIHVYGKVLLYFVTLVSSKYMKQVMIIDIFQCILIFINIVGLHVS